MVAAQRLQLVLLLGVPAPFCAVPPRQPREGMGSTVLVEEDERVCTDGPCGLMLGPCGLMLGPCGLMHGPCVLMLACACVYVYVCFMIMCALAFAASVDHQLQWDYGCARERDCACVFTVCELLCEGGATPNLRTTDW